MLAQRAIELVTQLLRNGHSHLNVRVCSYGCTVLLRLATTRTLLYLSTNPIQLLNVKARKSSAYQLYICAYAKLTGFSEKANEIHTGGTSSGCRARICSAEPTKGRILRSLISRRMRSAHHHVGFLVVALKKQVNHSIHQQRAVT
jgi:hypothetical protein